MPKELQTSLTTVYVRHLLQQFEYFYQPASCFDAEAVHQLRLVLKKFKAVRTFIITTHPEAAAKLKVKSLRRFFNALGKLRVLQVSAEVFCGDEFAGSQAGSLFMQHIELRMLQQCNNLANNCLARDKGAKPFIRTIDFLTQCNAGQLIAQGEVYLCQLGGQLQAYQQDNLHQARIILKQIIYLMAFLRSLDSDFLSPKVDLARLKSAAGLLGDWHDLFELGKLVASYPGVAHCQQTQNYYRQLSFREQQLAVQSRQELVLCFG
jgi:CHAD domain-containing protein